MSPGWDGIGPVVAGLLLVLAAAVIAWIVWRRPLYERIRVAFGSLWRRALADEGSRLPWREILIIVLFAGALTALAVGLAGPRVAVDPPKRVAVLLDASASMDARDAAGVRRIDRARLVVRDLLDALGEDHQSLVVRVSSEARVLEPWALAAVEPDDASTDFGPAVALAASWLRRDRGAAPHLVVVTDQTPEIEGWTGPLHVVGVGEAASNLSISALGASPGSGGKGGVEVLVTVTNHAASAARVRVVLHTDAYRIGQADLGLGPRSSETRQFHLDQVPDRRIWASLVEAAFDDGSEDALWRDDQRVTWVETTGQIEVALVSPGNRFLEGALGVLGGVHVDRMTPAEATPARLGHANVVILDGVDVAVPAGAGVFRIGATSGTAVESPRMSDWHPDHPVTRRVNLDDLTLAKAHALRAHAGDVVLAGIEEGPVLLARETPRGRVLELGFDLAASDFPLRLAFPVFVDSAVRWLAAETGSKPLTGVAGLPVALPGGAESAQIVGYALMPRAEDAPLAAWQAVSGAAVTAGPHGAEFEARRAGMYALQADDGTTMRLLLGVDPAESVLSARPPQVATLPLSSRRAQVPPLVPLLFALAALLLTGRALLR